MDITTLLPIGSVVEIKQGTKKLMIFGIAQKMHTKENTELTYDYIGVPYPEGNIDENYQFMFSHSDIDFVHFFGCMDREREEYIEEFNQFLNNQNPEQTDKDKKGGLN